MKCIARITHCSVVALFPRSEQANILLKQNRQRDRLFSEQPQYPVYQCLKKQIKHCRFSNSLRLVLKNNGHFGHNKRQKTKNEKDEVKKSSHSSV